MHVGHWGSPVYELYLAKRLVKPVSWFRRWKLVFRDAWARRWDVALLDPTFSFCLPQHRRHSSIFRMAGGVSIIRSILCHLWQSLCLGWGTAFPCLETKLATWHSMTGVNSLVARGPVDFHVNPQWSPRHHSFMNRNDVVLFKSLTVYKSNLWEERANAQNDRLFKPEFDARCWSFLCEEITWQPMTGIDLPDWLPHEVEIGTLCRLRTLPNWNARSFQNALIGQCHLITGLSVDRSCSQIGSAFECCSWL